jgi:hypothetical protein
MCLRDYDPSIIGPVRDVRDMEERLGRTKTYRVSARLGGMPVDQTYRCPRDSRRSRQATAAASHLAESSRGLIVAVLAKLDGYLKRAPTWWPRASAEAVKMTVAGTQSGVYGGPRGTGGIQ